jgi:hypothetical protein
MLEHWCKVRSGFIVMKLWKANEWVTGFVPGHFVVDSVSELETCEHVWGHYFHDRNKAYEDYLARIDASK